MYSFQRRESDLEHTRCNASGASAAAGLSSGSPGSLRVLMRTLGSGRVPRGGGSTMSPSACMRRYLDLDHIAVLVECRGRQMCQSTGGATFFVLRQIAVLVNHGKVRALGAAMLVTARLLSAFALCSSVASGALFRFQRAGLLAFLPKQAVLKVFDLGILERRLLSQLVDLGLRPCMLGFPIACRSVELDVLLFGERYPLLQERRRRLRLRISADERVMCFRARAGMCRAFHGPCLFIELSPVTRTFCPNRWLRRILTGRRHYVLDRAADALDR